MEQSLRIRFQIHLDLSFPHDVTGLRVILKIRAIDLIETAGIAPVERDGDIVQLDAATLLELHRLTGLNFKEGVSLFGTGHGKTLRALLDFDANFPRDLPESVLHS